MGLKIESVPIEGYEEYIRFARRRTLEGALCCINEDGIRPRPYATYFVASRTETGEIVGLGEVYPYSAIGLSFRDVPQGAVRKLHEAARFEETVHMRTLYVEPAYRVRTRYFAALAVASAMHFHRRGFRWATVATSSPPLLMLYEKFGGETLGTCLNTIYSDLPISLCLFDLPVFIGTPIASRVLRNVNLANLCEQSQDAARPGGARHQ